MKKLMVLVSLIAVLCLILCMPVLATEEVKDPCAGCEICNPEEIKMEDMPEMVFDINGAAFVESLGYMGKGLVGIFVVTLVIIGVVAILNWHGRSMERRNKNK